MIGTIDIEREGYYNRNGWGIESREVGYGNESFEKGLINRERDLQRQWEKERIDQGIIKDTKSM